MKKILLFWLLSGLFFSTATAQYDDVIPSGYEGDYFSLEGAIDLFKNSSSLDEFEQRLNTNNNWVNDLDLDYDGRTDYIRVEHRSQGDFHIVILQALVGSWDVQDVAVIEIEKISSRDAILQIIGDEDLYGEQVIVEAYDQNTMVRGNESYNTSHVNVYNWSPIQFMFRPGYVRYVSPYNQKYYPLWYSPWDRHGLNVFRPKVVHYATYYRPVTIHRVKNAHQFYTPNRTYSRTVLRNTNKVRVNQGKPVVKRARIQNSRDTKTSRTTTTRTTTTRTNVRNTDKSTMTNIKKTSKTTPTKTTTKTRRGGNSASVVPSRIITTSNNNNRVTKRSTTQALTTLPSSRTSITKTTTTRRTVASSSR